MFVGTATSSAEAEVATPRRAPARRPTGGRQSRWETDALDLKTAGSSVLASQRQLLEAFAQFEADARRSRELLEYSLDQAALAHGLLGAMLGRHRRSLVRPTIEEDEEDENPISDKRREAKAKIRKKRRALRKRKRLCIDCPEPPLPAEAGHIRCKGHHKHHLARQAQLRASAES
jgi:hypothetical protein